MNNIVTKVFLIWITLQMMLYGGGWGIIASDYVTCNPSSSESERVTATGHIMTTLAPLTTWMLSDTFKDADYSHCSIHETPELLDNPNNDE